MTKDQEEMPSAASITARAKPLIESFAIEGLHGYRSLSLNTRFSGSVLIAPNGSGKTTFLGALDAFLKGQFTRLASLNFESITCRLRGVSEELTVTKQEIDDFSSIPSESSLVGFAKSWELAPKRVYFHWIRDIAPDLQYEMHICGTKDDALKLLDALRRDQTDLAKDVYFLLDNDFDGLKGREPGPEVFVTPTYSIENYLVCNSVLDDILKVELHCHGAPQCRANVREAFSKIYSQFLEVTKSLNWRIYLARRAKIRQVGDLPSKLSDIAVVSLLEVAASDTAASDAVVLEREPSAVEIEHHKPEFDSLIPQMNYRGKFAFLFFLRWLNLLASDRRSEQSRLFGKTTSALSPTNNFTLDMMASRSRPPRELNDFLQRFVAV